MGGINSGRRFRLNKRATTDSFRKLDVNVCSRNGWLRPGYRGGVFWHCNGKPTGDIVIETASDRVDLLYRTRPVGGAWSDMRESVLMERVPQHFGGERVWFRCPGCNCRRAHLYGGIRFLCRHCHRLTYESCNESAAMRALSMAQKLRMRLDGSPCLDEPLPGRPKWKHRDTFATLLSRIILYEQSLQKLLYSDGDTETIA